MTLTSRLRAFAVVAVVALVAAVPAFASGTGHGNKCGKGHAKHSKAIGKSCTKLNAHSSAVIRQAKREHESPATVVSEDAAGTADKADIEDEQDATENDGANENDGDATENDGDANDAENDANDD